MTLRSLPAVNECRVRVQSRPASIDPVLTLVARARGRYWLQWCGGSSGDLGSSPSPAPPPPPPTPRVVQTLGTPLSGLWRRVSRLERQNQSDGLESSPTTANDLVVSEDRFRYSTRNGTNETAYEQFMWNVMMSRFCFLSITRKSGC